MGLPLKLSWDMSQTTWASAINPVLNLPPNQGILLKNIKLAAGDNVINTKLGKQAQGWVIIDQDAASSIYRSAAFNPLTLTLHASAPCNLSLWIF